MYSYTNTTGSEMCQYLIILAIVNRQMSNDLYVLGCISVKETDRVYSTSADEQAPVNEFVFV